MAVSLAAAKVSLSEEWRPFVQGFRHAIGCYRQHVSSFTFNSTKEALRQMRDQGFALRRTQATARFHACLGEGEVSGLEKMGRSMAYLYYTQGLFPPQEDAGKREKFGADFTSCQLALLGQFGTGINRAANLAPKGEHLPSRTEIRSAQAMAREVSSSSILSLDFPSEQAGLGAWISWIGADLGEHQSLATLLGGLSHYLAFHGGTVSFQKQETNP